MTNAIQQDILDYLTDALTPHFQNFYTYHFDTSDNGIVVRCQITEESSTKTKVLRVDILKEHSQVLIPNIFMPESMRQQGIGKKLIRDIHSIAKQYGFRTYVVDLSNSFFEKLKRRGAHVVEDGETVEITDETRLN